MASPTTSRVQHPALILSPLAILSGILGTFALGFGYGEAPHLGLHMVLTGVWFGLVVGYGVWRWGAGTWRAAALAVLATWIAWELAVNLALQLEENWLKLTPLPDGMRTYVSGFAAGAVGAFGTWAGAASSSPSLRPVATPVAIVAAGALLGLLLPWTNRYDDPAILLLPWQAVIAAMLGVGLAPVSERSYSAETT